MRNMSASDTSVEAASPDSKAVSEPANVEKEFLPLPGYDAPDFSGTLILCLLKSQHRLNQESLANLTLPEVRVLLQEYAEKLENCMKKAQKFPGLIEEIMQELTGLVNEAVAFGTCLGVANPRILESSGLRQSNAASDGDKASRQNVIAALHLSDEQERLLLAMRCTYAWGVSLMGSNAGTAGENPTHAEAGSNGSEGRKTDKADQQKNRQKCLFTDRALRQVLNPMQAAIAFSLVAPLYPDMLPLVDVLAAARERASTLAPALRPLSPEYPRVLGSETQVRLRRSLDFQVPSTMNDVPGWGHVQPLKPASSESSPVLLPASPHVGGAGLASARKQCGEVTVGSKGSRKDVLAALVALSKTPNQSAAATPAAAAPAFQGGSFDIAQAMQTVTLTRNASRQLSTPHDGQAMQTVTLTRNGSRQLSSPHDGQELLGSIRPVMGEIGDWPVRSNQVSSPATPAWPAAQGQIRLSPNPVSSFGRDYVRHWTGGTTHVLPSSQDAPEASGSREADEGFRRTPNTSGAMLADEGCRGAPNTSGAMLADLQACSSTSDSMPKEQAPRFVARRASSSSPEQAAAGVDTLTEAGGGGGDRAATFPRRRASMSAPRQGSGVLDTHAGFDMQSSPGCRVSAALDSLKLLDQATTRPGTQSAACTSSSGHAHSEGQLANFCPPGKEQYAENRCHDAPLPPVRVGPADVPRSPFSFAPQTLPTASEAMGLWPPSQANSGTSTEGGTLEEDLPFGSYRSVSLRNWLETGPWVPHPVGVADKQVAPGGGPFKPHPIGCTVGLEGPTLRRFLSVGPSYDAQPAASPEAAGGFRRTLLGGWQPGTGYQSRAGQSVEGVRGAAGQTLRRPHSMPDPSRGDPF